MIFGGYKASKLKPQLKMAVTRFQISANKKSALMKQQIREIAILLADDPPREEKARIKAEALIRDDNTVEAYEILQLNCELLSERIHLITHSKRCPPDLVECISTLIWASSVVDIPELVEIRKQFRYKYGKEFEADAMQNAGGILNGRVTAKLSVQPPSAYLVQTYLEKIADEEGVQWKPTMPLKAENISDPMPAPTGYTVPNGRSGLNPPASPSVFEHKPPPPGGDNPPSSGGSSISSLTSDTGRSGFGGPSLPPPMNPTAPRGGDVPSTIDEVEEVDIPVFGASRPPGGGGSSGGGGGGGGMVFGGTPSGPGAGGGQGGSTPPADGAESYDDLAARFAMLQKNK